MLTVKIKISEIYIKIYLKIITLAQVVPILEKLISDFP